MSLIHPTAIIDSTAELDPSVQVGAFAMVGPRVRVGAGTKIHPYAQVVQDTTLGERNTIHSHAVIGGDPQDKKYAGEPTRLTIGDGNLFRECVTVNRGTVQDGGLTTVGSNNWVMAYVHIAHDCHIGSNTIIANACQVAGHVHLGDFAILGGNTGVHQFVHIGAHAMTGGGTTLLQDLPPYVICSGNPAAAHGLNSEGLRRRGFSPEQLSAIKRAYKTIYKSSLTLAEAIATLRQEHSALLSSALPSEQTAAKDLERLISFLDRPGRGIVR